VLFFFCFLGVDVCGCAFLGLVCVLRAGLYGFVVFGLVLVFVPLFPFGLYLFFFWPYKSLVSLFRLSF